MQGLLWLSNQLNYLPKAQALSNRFYGTHASCHKLKQEFIMKIQGMDTNFHVRAGLF